ncbi:hypothetical protein ASB7_16380 [Helicobacter ailurogastricus]|nr:hypothetical protein ASB7_16380 [Helicobacter ailurogastricus]
MATPSPVYRKFCALLGLLAFNDPCLAYDYKLSGFANQASTIGFNEAPINKSKGIYPMQQYATIAGYLSLGFSLLPKRFRKKGHSLKGLVGGMVGGCSLMGQSVSRAVRLCTKGLLFMTGFMAGG